jgi:thiamine biosynthesis protein ThiS
MELMVNGVRQEMPAPLSISDYLAEKGYEWTLVSVELNFNIVKRDKWTATFLTDGDNLEIIRFVGGG